MLFFVLNVKNDRLDDTLIIIILAEYTGVIFTLTSGKHDFMIIILTLFLKYYDVNYLFEKDKLIKRALAKNLNLTKIRCSNHISKLN